MLIVCQLSQANILHSLNIPADWKTLEISEEQKNSGMVFRAENKNKDILLHLTEASNKDIVNFNEVSDKVIKSMLQNLGQGKVSYKQQSIINDKNAWQYEISFIRDGTSFSGLVTIANDNDSIVEIDMYCLTSSWENYKFLMKTISSSLKRNSNPTTSNSVRPSNQSNLPRCQNGVQWTNCFGSIVYDNQSRYEGEFIDGLRGGNGTLIFGKSKYIGEFKEGTFNGFGVLIIRSENQANEERYEAQWKNNIPLKGLHIYSNGNKYDGEFNKEGKPNGNGIFYLWDDKNQKITSYGGIWKDGILEGSVKITFSDGETYVGFLRNDKFNGQGTLTLVDGSKYSGDFLNNVYSGRGTFLFADGRKYVGEWKDGKYNGQGILSNANGTIINQGLWKDNNYIGSEKNNSANLIVPIPSNKSNSSSKAKVLDSNIQNFTKSIVPQF
jgi:hypothetical protein